MNEFSIAVEQTILLDLVEAVIFMAAIVDIYSRTLSRLFWDLIRSIASGGVGYSSRTCETIRNQCAVTDKKLKSLLPFKDYRVRRRSLSLQNEARKNICSLLGLKC